MAPLSSKSLSRPSIHGDCTLLHQSLPCPKQQRNVVPATAVLNVETATENVMKQNLLVLSVFLPEGNVSMNSVYRGVEDPLKNPGLANALKLILV